MLSPTNAMLIIVVMFGTTKFAEAICANCLNSDRCDSATGYCMDFQCKYYWKNQPECDTKCPPLTWGINCPNTCHCPVNDTCNIVNGACGTDKCAARWYGVACQKRMTELYDPPTVVNFSSSGSLLQWTRWSSLKDYGDGPAASYTVQFCKESLSESCWQAVANGTVMEPNGTSTDSFYAWVPGTANTTYWYRVFTNMLYLQFILTGYPSRASLPVTLPSMPTNISSTDLPPVGPVAVSTNATSAVLVWQQPQLSSAIILPGGALLQVLRYNVTYAMVASLSTPGTCRFASNVSSGVSFSQLVPAARTSLLITDLMPFVQYSLAVKALYNANYSSNATSISFSTTAIAPATAPDNITTWELSSVSVTISWLQPLCSAVTGPIVRYDVSVFSDSSGVVVAAATDSINDPSVTAKKVTGLRPLTNYSATVRLVNAAGVGPWSRSQSFRTLDDVPPPPENVIVSVVTATRAIISWSLANSTTTVKNVTIAVHDKGRVGCTNSDTLKYVQMVAAGAQRQLELPGLSPSTRYSAELLCTNDVGSSKVTAIVFFETPALAPSASVTNVSITNVTARGMFVIWSPVSCESANGIPLWYDVVATPTGGSGSSGPMQKTTVAATAPAAAWLTGLQPGTRYGVSVRAVNVEGPGPWGNASSPLLTPNEAPSAVTLLTIDNITQSTAIARWVSMAKNFTITLTKVGAIACGGVNDEALVRLDRVVLSSTYTFAGLLPGVRYRVQVAAVNDVAISDPAITEFVTASSTPNGSVGTPTLNYIPSSNRLAVTWSPIPCEMIYGVFRQYDVMITVNGNQTVVSNSFPLIEVSNLLPTANYSIQVRVVNDAGVGNWSSPITTVSPYKIPPMPVTNLSFNVTYTEASVSWNVPAGSNQGVTYSAMLELLRSGSCSRLQQPVLVQRLYLNPSAVQVAAQSLSRSAAIQLSGLQPWYDYRLTVTAQNDVGARSTSDNFTTLFGSRPTVAVSNLLVSNVTAFSALASWQPLPCDAWTSPDIAYYYKLTDESGSPIATNTTKNTTVLLTSLRTYRFYNLVVHAVVDVSFGPSSAAVYFTTLLAVPTRVQNIDVNVTSPNSVQLRWSPPAPDDAPVSTYELVYQRLATGGCPTTSPSFSGAATRQILTTASLNLEKLQPWSTYVVWLSSSNLIGRSPNASTTFNLTYDVPDAPLNLTGRTISDTKLAYSWSQPDCLGLRGPLLGYEYKLVVQSLSTVLKNGTTNSLNVTLVELSAYTEYAFFVRVKNSAGSGPWSSLPVLSTLPADPPAPPLINLLSATSPDELLVGFNNTDVSNVKRYCLTYTATDTNDSATADQAASCTLEGAANNSFVVVRLSNLMPYTNYRIQVRLGTVAGWSGNVVSAVMRTDSSVPSEPTSLSLAEFNESSLFFAWKNPLSPNGPLLSYQLSYSQCSSSGATHNCSYSGVVSVLSARAQLLSELCPGTCYRVAVAAATDKGLGNVTAVQVFTAPGQPATPPTPELLSVSSTTITVRIYAVQPLYGPIVSYLILVSRSIQKQRRSAASGDPSSPASINSAGTIYAEIAAGDVPTNGYVIVLGDNRTTAGGRYISLPLEPSTSYDMSQVAVSTLSNVTRMSTRVVLTVVTTPVPETALPFWLWIIVAALAVFVLIVLIVVPIICLRRKHRPKLENAKYETYNSSDNDLALYRDQLELINNQSWPDGGKDGETSSVPKPVWHGFWNLIYKLETPRYVLTEQQPESAAELLAYSGLSISFEQEFQLLPRGRQASCDIAQRPINAELNRVSHILPYDASRVKLHYPLPATGTDYINASYIRGYSGNPAYIATACPFNDKTRAAFWCMIVQENVAHVVMVTNVVDGSIVKTSQFWPASHGSANIYGDFAVQNVGVSTVANFTVHRLRVDCRGGGDGYDGVCKEVTLFHFTSWPEHGVPSDALPFLEFCHVVRGRTKHHRGKRSKGLMAVMCGTGVSTTGVFIAADVLMDQADLENVVSMHKVVRCLREDRMHMVRTLRQYYFLYDVLFEHLICHRMSCQVLQLRQHYKMLTSQRSEGRAEFTREFAVLEQFTPQFTKEQCRDALLDANRPKNYSIDVLPPDVYRPVLKGAGGPGNDYINAVFADGYVFKAHYIVTQTPLANTIVDFWKLVYEQNVTAIVSLDEPRDISGGSTSSDPFVSWLPAAGVHRSAEHSLDEPAGVDTVNAMAYGPFCVKCTAQETQLHLTVRRLNLYNKLCPNARPRELLQLHLTTWPLGNQKAPKTAQALVALENRLNRWMSQWNMHSSNGGGAQWSPAVTGPRFDSTQSPPRRVLAHCSDGVSRSGLFVAACALCERIRVEPTINVFHVVKALKVRRPSAVIDEEQYRFLYRLAWDYAHTPEGVRGWSAARTMTEETRPTVTAAMRLQSESLDETPDDITDNYHDDHDDAIGDGPRQKRRLVS